MLIPFSLFGRPHYATCVVHIDAKCRVDMTKQHWVVELSPCMQSGQDCLPCLLNLTKVSLEMMKRDAEGLASDEVCQNEVSSVSFSSSYILMSCPAILMHVWDNGQVS
jgi:hypothetical protein